MFQFKILINYLCQKYIRIVFHFSYRTFHFQSNLKFNTNDNLFFREIELMIKSMTVERQI